jgi:metallophosphoesterase (TIGR00282 family)
VNVLFFGDVIGQVGREGLKKALPDLREKYRPDFIIVNAENAAHGKGLTPRVAQEFWAMGADVLTMGNHTFDRKEIGEIIDDPRILRPANYPARVQGHGHAAFTTKSGERIAVVQVMGRTNMRAIDCPFQAMDRLLPELKKQAPVIVVDMHAEITAEKGAMGWYLDGQVSAVIGSHTHVATADERLLPKGTAYQTDAGPCGPYDSIIGGEVAPAIERFLTGLHVPINVATGDAQICGCAIVIDSTTGLSRSIERIQVRIPLQTTVPS